MSDQHAPTKTGKRTNALATALRGRWLVLARVGWAALVVFTLTIFFASLPVYLEQLQTICIGPACSYLQPSPEQVGTLKGIGLSTGDYAVYTLTLTLAIMVVCLVISTLIVWRKSDDRMAMLVAFMLVTFGPIFVTATVPESSPLQVPNECLYFLALSLVALVFLLFPTGQFVPRWTRWTLVVFIVGQVSSTFFPDAPFMLNTSVSLLSNLLSLTVLAILVVVQLYRYRRVSSTLQRQQTKWVVFGLAVPITFYVSGTVLYLIFPALADASSLYGAPYQLAFNVVSTFLPLLIPLSFGFAMLRSRLWEIDAIINRTLVYGAFTVSLSLIYVSLIFGLQALLRGIISQNNSVAIVLSTLAIVALFQPLRRSIQRIIDRRFYRSKYDAAKTLAAFSATLRNEVDLEQLSEQLVAVVKETMQPSHVSLWLRPPEPSRKQQTWPLPELNEEEKVEP